MTGSELRKRSVSSCDETSPSPLPTERGTTPAAKTGVWADRNGILLLLALYTAQGLPFGLIFGSIPFLLKPHCTYAQLATFSLCSLPYALKLLIAPLVDGGRPPIPLPQRPAWIVPPLMGAGAILTALSTSFATWVNTGNVRLLTPFCFFIIALTAVQDVAVDGWSLELLSEQNVAYASVCQSLGTSMGYLATFTVFLALNDPNFCGRYIWPIFAPDFTGPAISLGTALRATGIMFISVAMVVALSNLQLSSKNENEDDKSELERFDVRRTGSLVDQEASERQPKPDNDSANISLAYRSLWHILRLRPVQQLVFCLLVSKCGFSAFDSVVSLKLIDHGYPKEEIAAIAVVQAPVQLLGTIIVGRWAAQGAPEKPYLAGYALRFLVSLTGPFLVYLFAASGGAVTTKFYVCLVAVSLVYGIAADCLMFVSVGALFLRITSSSTAIGGSYLTLLYATQNLAGMWPKSVTLALVERLTIHESCTLSDVVKECAVRIDGFYVISAVLAFVAALVGWYLNRTIQRLVRLPLDSWKPVLV